MRRVASSPCGPRMRTSCPSTRCTTAGFGRRPWSSNSWATLLVCRMAPPGPQRAQQPEGGTRRATARTGRWAQAIEVAVPPFNGIPTPADWCELDELIGVQHWRAAYFRVAADDINYRRFFSINELAGLRMECRICSSVPPARIPASRDGILDVYYRPRRWAAGPEGLPAGAARAGAAVLLPVGREGPRPPRTHCVPTGRCPARPVTNSQTWCRDCWSILRRGGVHLLLHRLHRQDGQLRHHRARLQDPYHAQRDGQRAERASARRRPHRPAEPAHGRFHPQHHPARVAGGGGVLPCLPAPTSTATPPQSEDDRRDIDCAIAQARRNETDV